MPSEILSKEELFREINDAVSQINTLVTLLNEKQLNAVPYTDSWTAGQLVRHVAKSISGMAEAMSAAAKQTDRDPAERIPALKKTFLDFLHKMQSPEMIVPEEMIYMKQKSMDELNNAFQKLKKNAAGADLSNLVEGLPFGPVTKLEILHFSLYHTQRHLHQMRKISEGLHNDR